MIEPVRGHSASRLRTSSIASKNSLPSPGRCSSNQTAAKSSSSSASAENSTGNVTERAWNGFAHEPRATVVPGPHRTMHAVHAARAPPPTPHGRRRGRRARHDRDWPGGLQRTRRGDRREGSAHHAGASPDRSPSPRRVPPPERDRRSACVRRHHIYTRRNWPQSGSVGHALTAMVTPAQLRGSGPHSPGRPLGNGTASAPDNRRAGGAVAGDGLVRLDRPLPSGVGAQGPGLAPTQRALRSRALYRATRGSGRGRPYQRWRCERPGGAPCAFISPLGASAPEQVADSVGRASGMGYHPPQWGGLRFPGAVPSPSQPVCVARRRPAEAGPHRRSPGRRRGRCRSSDERVGPASRRPRAKRCGVRWRGSRR